MATKTIKLEVPFKKLLDSIDQLTHNEKLIVKKRLEKEKIIHPRYKKIRVEKSKKHSIMELEGLGANLWQEINVEEYINKERESWD